MRAFRVLVALCAASLVAGFLVHSETPFPWAAWPGFSAVFGFVVFSLIVLSGRPLRRLLMRDEDYYDR